MGIEKGQNVNEQVMRENLTRDFVKEIMSPPRKPELNSSQPRTLRKKLENC